MSNQTPDNEYDGDVRAWLAPLGGDAAPVNREFLRGLRERAAEEFERAAEAHASQDGEMGLRTLPHSGPLPGEEGSKAWRFAPTRKWLVAAAACLAAVGMWLSESALSSADSLTLGDVLRSSASARRSRIRSTVSSCPPLRPSSRSRKSL